MNLLGVALFFVSMFGVRHCWPGLGIISVAMISLLVTALPLWVYDLLALRVCERPSSGLNGLRPANMGRLVRKLIGLYGTFLIILTLYHLNPFYFRSSAASTEFYSHFFVSLNILAPWIIVLSFIYFYCVDRRQKDPCDSYWHMGCLLTGRWKDADGVILKEHARVWFIKGFFIPFMFASMIASMHGLLQFDWGGENSFISVYNQLLDAIYLVDILFGVLGYVLTVRLLDTHIQSTDPTWAGWLSCLACYHPFYVMFGLGLFQTEDGFYWDQWLASQPLFYWPCAVLLLLAVVIYSLATVSFGYRSSNLTYRGIITSGPYRWSKHPAYIAKVISWWLFSLPFISISTGVAMLLTFNMCIVSFIYYLRARTEENHLSNYPEYVQYANWINEHGVFSFLGKMFPALRYSEEKCKESKSLVWFKQLKLK
jgi:isoprenylcysteine carboxyl methyltransferase (ICMT) family protein YpbQ